jgi:Peptidase family M28
MITPLLLAAFVSTAPIGGDSEAMDRALAGVSQATIRADLDFLAADAMAGRDTPSDELELAAGYLLNRLQRMGLSPGANGSWFQTYELERTALSTDSRLFLDCQGLGFELRPLEGFLWVSCRRDEALTAGTAVSIGDASKEALGAVPVGALEGRWALATSAPKMLQTTRRRLSKAGAIGLLVVPVEARSELELEQLERAVARTESRLEFGNHQLSTTDGERPESKPDFPIPQLTSTTTAQWLEACPDTDLAVGSVLDLQVREERRLRTEVTRVRNLCALLPGTDAELAAEVIVCSAHYDHVGVRGGRIYPGADDNASGTVGLLALAEALLSHGPVERSVLFVWLSGEEKGLWGSEAFCNSVPLDPELRVAMNLNLDMIGRTAVGELYITPSRDHEAFGPLSELAYELSASEGFPDLQGQDEFYRSSDHYNFAKILEVPAVFLSTGDHPDYHEPGDTPDKIDVEKLSRVVRLAIRLVDGMAELALELPVAR